MSKGFFPIPFWFWMVVMFGLGSLNKELFSSDTAGIIVSLIEGFVLTAGGQMTGLIKPLAW